MAGDRLVVMGVGSLIVTALLMGLSLTNHYGAGQELPVDKVDTALVVETERAVNAYQRVLDEGGTSDEKERCRLWYREVNARRKAHLDSQRSNSLFSLTEEMAAPTAQTEGGR